MENKPIFNLYFRKEDALKAAKKFTAEHKDANGKDYFIWENPKNWAGGSIRFDTSEIFADSFDADIAELYKPGEIEAEAKAALIWMMRKYNRTFDRLEIDEVIVGITGGSEDKEVAIFTYLSKEQDAMRDFIEEIGYRILSK